MIHHKQSRAKISIAQNTWLEIKFKTFINVYKRLYINVESRMKYKNLDM